MTMEPVACCSGHWKWAGATLALGTFGDLLGRTSNVLRPMLAPKTSDRSSDYFARILKHLPDAEHNRHAIGTTLKNRAVLGAVTSLHLDIDSYLRYGRSISC